MKSVTEEQNELQSCSSANEIEEVLMPSLYQQGSSFFVSCRIIIHVIIHFNLPRAALLFEDNLVVFFAFLFFFQLEIRQRQKIVKNRRHHDLTWPLMVETPNYCRPPWLPEMKEAVKLKEQ